MNVFLYEDLLKFINFPLFGWICFRDDIRNLPVEITFNKNPPRSLLFFCCCVVRHAKSFWFFIAFQIKWKQHKILSCCRKEAAGKKRESSENCACNFKLFIESTFGAGIDCVLPRDKGLYGYSSVNGGKTFDQA